MTESQILDALTDGETLALTALGEARGDRKEGGSSVEERLAMMLTARNRSAHPARFGASIKAVCLKPSQYSCWLPSDPNRAQLLTWAAAMTAGAALASLDPLVRETLYLAEGVIHGDILDTTNGATHYYSPASMKPAGSVPAWARGQTPCARVGGEVFYKGV